MTVLSYLFGPLSVLASGEGRKSRAWVLISSISALLLVIFAAGPAGWAKPVQGSQGAIIAWLIIGIAGLIAGFAAWSRGIISAARENRLAFKNLHHIVKRPWLNGLLGMVLPGFGLYLSGRKGRASIAVWSMAAVSISALILANGAWLWGWSHGGGFGASTGRALEYIFVVAATTGLIGVAAWIVQAMDGARLAAAGTAGTGASRGDYAAIMLLVAIVAFTTMFQNEDVAASLDGQASEMFDKGYRLIPMLMSSAAAKIDPARPEYSARLIGIYEEMGDREAAKAVRAELFGRVAPVAGLFSAKRFKALDGTEKPALQSGAEEDTNKVSGGSAPYVRDIDYLRGLESAF